VRSGYEVRVEMELPTGAALPGALAIAVGLAALHVAAPHIRRIPGVPESATGSFAGGLAVAYVFLHLLPEIAAGDEAVGEALSDVVRPTPLLELVIFLVALTGFTVFFGLERLAERSSGAAGEPGVGIYRLHLSSFLVYNALITYTMALRLRTGVVFALLFAVAMGLHFVLTDRGLEERHPRRFARRGRYALAAALLVGWGLSVLFAPTSTVVVGLLTALLGGAVLLNVFKHEIPPAPRSRFRWFLGGLVLYSALLGLVTLLGG
jgi:hypothetical protein